MGNEVRHRENDCTAKRIDDIQLHVQSTWAPATSLDAKYISRSHTCYCTRGTCLRSVLEHQQLTGTKIDSCECLPLPSSTSTDRLRWITGVHRVRNGFPTSRCRDEILSFGVLRILCNLEVLQVRIASKFHQAVSTREHECRDFFTPSDAGRDWFPAPVPHSWQMGLATGIVLHKHDNMYNSRHGQ